MSNHDVNLIIKARDEASKKFKQLQKTMTATGDRMMGIGKQFMFVGGAITASLAGITKIFANVGDNFDKMSARTGITVESLSRLEFAATRSGSSLEDVEKGVKRMSRFIYDMERGLSTSVDVFDDLGLTLKDLKGLQPENQFALISDRISKITDMTTKAAIAQQVFGRAGTMLLPMIADYAELRQEAEELGYVLDTKTATAAAILTDAMGDVKLMLRNTAISIGAALEPALTALSIAFQKNLRKIKDWILDNPGFVKAFAVLGVSILGVGGALVGLGLSLKITAFALGGLIIPLKIITGLFTTIFSVTGLKIAVIAGFAAAILKLTGVFDLLGATMGGIGKHLKDFFSYMGKAISAGDFKAAWELMANSAKMAFAKIQEAGSFAWMAIQDSAINMVTHIWEGWSWLASGIQTLWAKVTTGVEMMNQKSTNRLMIGMTKLHERFPKFFEDVLGVDHIEDFDKAREKINSLHEEEISKIQQERTEKLQAIKDEYNAKISLIKETNKLSKDENKVEHQQRIKQLEAEREEALKNYKAQQQRLYELDTPRYESKRSGLAGMFDDLEDLINKNTVMNNGPNASPLESRFLNFAPGTQFKTAEEQTAQSTQKIARDIPSEFVKTRSKLDDILDAIRNGGSVAMAVANFSY